MKAFRLPATLATLLLVPISAVFAADVNMSIDIGQPGFYGHIDIGNAPPPQVIYPQPVIIARPPQAVAVPAVPIYLRVPPGHQKNWRKYCRRYSACDRPVYFVDDRWYQEVYVPHYQEHREEYRGRGQGRGRWRDEGRDRDDDRHGEGRGHRGRDRD